MENIRGKRLLLLGGSSWKQSLKNFAKTYGVTLIATGNDSSAGIFEIADECYNIDSTNAEKMKKLIKEKNIDGVYMGGSEAVISSACVYLNELGMPCYCTKEQWEYLQNKANFKQLCIDFELPVVPRYKVEYQTFDRDVKGIEFPVITKPADGCGSNGFSVCHTLDELRKGYDFASENSSSGAVMVEKFVKNKGVVVFYTFSKGKMYFSGLEDKYPVKYTKNSGYVGGLFIFESRFTDEFRNLFDAKLQKMFSSIGIKEGTVWIEVFHDGEEYYFNEVGYRYGGSISIYPVDYLYKINQVYADMYYALTGKSNIFGYDSLISQDVKRKKYYCIYPIYSSAGKIFDIAGLDFLRKLDFVVDISLAKDVGDTVPESGSFSQIFALVHFVFDDLVNLNEAIKMIQEELMALDEAGKNKLYKIAPSDIVLSK